ncbi:AAA family ATPase [Blastococcus sp. SYSU D00922]
MAKAASPSKPARAGSRPVDITWLERERRVTESGVRNVFTPHKPVSETDLLFGRQDEVRGLFETLNTPGQHILLYGERGVGKTSLANVLAAVVRSGSAQELFTKRCDSHDSFATIMASPLARVGADLTLTQVEKSSGGEAGAALSAGPLSIEASRAREVVATYQATGKLSPSTVGAALGDLRGLLIIDEADAISEDDDRRQLAELIKNLSDSGSPFKIMIVGIAATGAELTAAHPSVARCLREVKLRRMATAELRAIVESGAGALGLHFDRKAVDMIVKLSAGYPHFTHLLALKCAEEAIGQRRNRIGPEDLRAALRLAVQDAEGTLRRVYGDAIRSQSDLYRQILVACATFETEEFSSADLRDAIERVTGSPISQGSLNNYFQRLVSNTGSAILRRTGQGHYRFEDPRMASYVRIANEMV